MKTTSYKISKQLAEAGFKADFYYCYHKNQNEAKGCFNKYFEIDCWEGEDIANYYPSYDLETLLEALPCDLEGLCPSLTLRPKRGRYMVPMIGYDACCGDLEPSTMAEEGESLVDIAARLLLELHAKGLVKFE